MNYKRRKKLFEDVSYVKQQLQNGVNPREIFDFVYGLSESLALVHARGKGYNFLKSDDNLLREDLWFDMVYPFSEGFALVKLEDRGWNFIKPDGNFLRDDLWFSWAEDFYDGFAPVEYNGRDCYIDTKGNLYDEDNNLINKVNENKRRVVRMTESQLRNTIKRVVAQCLNERRIR